MSERGLVWGHFMSNSKILLDRAYGPSTAVPHPDGGAMWIRPPQKEEFSEIHRLAHLEISRDVSARETLEAVHARNPDAFWVIDHQRSSQESVELIGFYTFLPLTKEGCDALEAGALDTKAPPVDMIAPFGTRPECLYLWGVVARRIAKSINPLISRAMGELYSGVKVYVTASTEGGLKAATERGFVNKGGAQNRMGSLLRLPMLSEAKPKVPVQPSIETIVATNAEHLQQIFAIRGAVFMAEQHCPYEEEFDGNDYCATHVLGLVDNVAAAVIRIRYFGEFAKLERLAVLKAYRGSPVTGAVIERALEICRRKGFLQVYGHTQVRLVGFWRKFGFEQMSRNSKLVFSDHEYAEISRKLEPHQAAIRMSSDPYVIIRPEGRWDDPGVLDRSATRPVTNPH
jgi:predicted GNAT family N-acyltransferase